MIKHIKQVFLTASLLFTSMLVADPLTPNELHATMGIVTNFILDDGIQFHGKSYVPVTSAHTGRVWLDRNIGASKKCTSYDYPLCYGDLFQWGRKYDGHESSVDNTVARALDINNAGAEFIRGNADWAFTDLSYGNKRATNWLKTDGSSVCPVGYRVPLRSELNAEVGDISNKETAYANFLKFPAAGYRVYGSANYSSVGTLGAVWSVSSSESRASYFRFYSASNWNDVGARGYGLSVRCIKHVGKPLIYHNTTTYSAVTSPYTGRIWLDRNLGAARVCTSFNDTACYGDYYQWGRNFDGHENSGSTNFNVLANNVNNVGHENFILSVEFPADWASIDVSGAIRLANWSQTDGSSVCPVGFRVPTLDELAQETLNNGVNDKDKAFLNFLKLPSAGYHYYFNGNLSDIGTSGYVWANSIDGPFTKLVYFDSGNAAELSQGRANGQSVRCLKD